MESQPMKDRTDIARPFWQLLKLTEPIILASQSPRRAQILKNIGIPFEVVPSVFEEDDYGNWDRGKTLHWNAVQKAGAVKAIYPHRAILAADTVVVLGARVLGKPNSKGDARRTLHLLSGQSHEVWTAMCYIPAGSQDERTAMCKTDVAFRSLSRDEIEAYLETGEPMDKAGSYGIQGIGGLFVRSIEGCYFNVMGLPVSLLWDLLKSGKD